MSVIVLQQDLNSPAGSHPTLATTLRAAAARSPKASGIICDGRTLNYAELDIAARRLARSLIASGACPGDRIALHLSNGPELAIGYFACFYAGAIAVPVDARFKGAEVAYVLGHSGASIYIGEPGFSAEIEEIRPRLANIRRFVVGLEDFADCGGRSALSSLPIVAADRPAVIVYASGSTARPKGVTHTHRTLLNAARGFCLRRDEVAVLATPMACGAGLATLIACVDAGASGVIMADPEPAALLDAIARHGGAFMFGTPATYRGLIDAQAARARDLPAATRYLASGDQVPPALKNEFARCFGRPLREVFARNETGPIAASGCVAAHRLNTFGRALPGVDIAVSDDRGDPVPLGAIGEMIVRSGALMVGYWNDPAATRDAFIDGWYRTGDLVSQDLDGSLSFHGRKEHVSANGEILRRALRGREAPPCDSSGRPATQLCGRWRRAPDGQLVRAWELMERRWSSMRASTTGGTQRSPGAGPAGRPAPESGAPSFWRWFVVAWIVAGYLLTGLASFLGG